MDGPSIGDHEMVTRRQRHPTETVPYSCALGGIEINGSARCWHMLHIPNQ